MVGTPSSNSWVACVLEIHEYKVFAKLRWWKKNLCSSSILFQLAGEVGWCKFIVWEQLMYYCNSIVQ